MRPRRVFRALSSTPIGSADYLLGAGQGVAGWLALSRAQNAGAVSSVAEIFGKALVIGGAAGIVSLFLMGSIYARLGSRGGKVMARSHVFHVLAYGGVPLCASLVLWGLTALLTGEATFEATPHPDVEGFVYLLLRIQFFTYVMLTVWSVIIQVMGLSEIQGLATRKALGLWILGQLIGFLALVFLMILVATFLPGSVIG
ncbi:MAG: hypothetical protein M3O06_03425 [Pseudomonadota bacterium]|nr:hypothetical protein [Pseudomonadota bacterium]